MSDFLANVYLIFRGPETSKFDVRRSGFFLLTPSPWPIYSSFAVFTTLTGLAAYMNYYSNGLYYFLFGVVLVIFAFLF